MSTKLYIGKVKEVSKQELYKLLSAYGLIKSLEDKDTYCFVEYQYESDARNAQYELDGKTVTNNRIVVQFSQKKDDQYKEAMPCTTRKIYVGNLNHKFTSQEMTDLFARFGRILDVIFKDTYALIEYGTQQQASEAVIAMNDKVVKGETLKVDLQKAYDEIQSQSNRIYIGKIGNLKKMDLILHFGQFGFIEDITLKEELYAFIQYRNLLQASKAIKEMNGADIKGNKIQVQEARSKNHLPPSFVNSPFQIIPKPWDLVPRNRSRSREKNILTDLSLIQ